MAIIPDPAGLKRSGVKPNKSVVSLENSGAEGLAAAKLGVAAGTGAGRVTRMALYHADQMDTQQAKAAELQLREGVLELSKKAMAVQGKDAYTQGPNGYNAQYDSEFKALQDRIAAANNLSENGLIKFNEAAKTSALNFRAKRYQHSMTQEDKHKAILFSKGLEVTVNEATTADNANVTATKITQGELEIIAEFKRQGITDPAIVDHAVLTFKGNVHGGIVDRLLANGDSGGAVAYIQTKQKAGEITGEQSLAMMKVVKPEVDYKEAQIAADGATKIFREGGSLDEVDAYLRNNTSTKEATESGFSLFTRQKLMIEAARKKIAAEIVGGARDGTGRGRGDPRLVDMKRIDPVTYSATMLSLNAIDSARRKNQFPEPNRSQKLAYYALKATGPNGEFTPEGLDRALSEIGVTLHAKGHEEIANRSLAEHDVKVKDIYNYKIDSDRKKLGYPADSSADDRRIIDGEVRDAVVDFITNHKRVPDPKEERRLILSASKKFLVEDTEYAFRTREMHHFEIKSKEEGNKVYAWPADLDDFFAPDTEAREKDYAWRWIKKERNNPAASTITDIEGLKRYYKAKEEWQERKLKKQEQDTY
jgi:hypothetical protein